VGSSRDRGNGAVCTSCYNGYVEKLNASGTALIYSTYFGLVGFGGAPSTLGSGIAVDSSGSAYLVGNSSAIPVKNPIQASLVGVSNAFIAKFSPDGSSLVYATYIGGSSPFSGDFATAVAVDQFGNAHVAGTSSSCDFPLTLNAFSIDCVARSYGPNIFVLTLNSTGSGILFSTFLRSGSTPQIVVDRNGNSYVAGITNASDFPVIKPVESTSERSVVTSFITKLDLSGKLLFSTYLGATTGGSQVAGIAVDSEGGIYVAGGGQGDFPLVDPIPSQVLQSTYYTLFVAKVSPNKRPQLSLSPRVSPLLTLRNVSSVPVTISSIVPSPNFTMGGNCGSRLAPGGACNLILEGAADNKTSGIVTITSNAYSEPRQFTIFKSPTGDTVGPIVSIFPTYVQFASQLIGTTSAAQRVVIENLGLQPAAINSISIIQPSAFHQTNDCPALLNPAASCTISITYNAATVQDSAQLAIVHDQYQTTVFLSGDGSGSAIAFSTNSVEFGSQAVGVAPLERIVNLANTTPYHTSVPSISASTGFTQRNTCETTLAPQASCRVSVTFVPTGNQDSTGTLTATGFGPGGSQKVTPHATGIAVGGLGISPVALSFFGYVGNATGPETVTLTNNSVGILVGCLSP
jgi:hypothetical protein